MPVKAVPEGFHTVTPLLVIRGGAKLIDFLKNAFGGEETVRMPLPSGEIMHAEVKIGNSIVMLNYTMGHPTTAASLFLYVNDADSVHRRALKPRATSFSMPSDTVMCPGCLRPQLHT